MRGAGTFVAMAITTVIVSGLLPSTPLPAQTVQILRDGDSVPLIYTNEQIVSSFGQEGEAFATLSSTPIPTPTPTPPPPPAPVPNIVTLEWDPSPDTTVIGYRLLMGTQSLKYVARITLGKQTSVKVFINHPATYFVVTAYNVDGLESKPSGEVVVIR
jgi:hypothetical protein